MKQNCLKLPFCSWNDKIVMTFLLNKTLFNPPKTMQESQKRKLENLCLWFQYPKVSISPVQNCSKEIQLQLYRLYETPWWHSHLLHYSYPWNPGKWAFPWQLCKHGPPSSSLPKSVYIESTGTVKLFCRNKNVDLKGPVTKKIQKITNVDLNTVYEYIHSTVHCTSHRH